MGYLVLLVVALVAGVIGARSWQRRRRDEIRSIHHYHDRLDTLHVEQHDRGGSVRVVHGEPEAHPSDAPHRPKLDPEAANLDTAGPFATPRERRRRHDRDWAIDRMQPRARVDTATVIVVAVVVLVLVAIALAGYLIQHGRGSTPTTTTTTTLHRTATSASGGPSRTVGPRSQQAAMAARQIDPNEIVALREGTGLLSSSRSVAVRATTTVHVSTSASASALRAVATGTVAVQVRG